MEYYRALTSIHPLNGLRHAFCGDPRGPGYAKRFYS